MRTVLIIFYIILALIGVCFAALNAHSVEVHFYFTTISVPISVLIIMVLGIGIILGLILFVGKYWRLKREYHRTVKQLKLTEKGIKNLQSTTMTTQR